jgi:hypothetical protein
MNLPDNHLFEARGVAAEKRWKSGYGVIKHSAATQARVKAMIVDLKDRHTKSPKDLILMSF